MSTSPVVPQTPPPTFFYKGTDQASDPSIGFAMTANNLRPALLVWLLITTNPVWLGNIAVHNDLVNQDAKGNPAGTTSLKTIADQLKLTPETVQFIFDIVNGNDEFGHPMKTTLLSVAKKFQTINAANTDSTAYRPPCPSSAVDVLNLIANGVLVADPSK